MSIESIIQGLQFTIDMFLFDPFTGEILKEPRNDEDKITIEVCREAIKILKSKSLNMAIALDAAFERGYDQGYMQARSDFEVGR